MDKNFLQNIINKLKKKGCDQSDVFFVKNSSLNSSVRLNKLEKNEYSENFEIGIRAIKGKKQSIISSNNTEDKNINLLIDRVFEMVSVVPDNQYCGLASDQEIESFCQKDFDDLDLFDQKIPTLSELNHKALELESSAMMNDMIINSEGAEVAWSKSEFFLGASNGLYQEFCKSNSSFILAILAGNESSMEREYDFKSEVYFNDLGDLEKVGRLTAEKAVAKLNSRKIKTCKASVMFDSKVASSLIRNLLTASNASLIARGTSFLKDKLNSKLFDGKVNIIDDPLMKRKSKSKLIDCEGIKSSKKNLIKDGELNFFFNSLEQSRQLNQRPTGHASRSPSSLPYPSSTNLYLDKGTVSKEEMLKSIKKGLLVTELMGSSINMSNGDYSRGASGFWIENGEIAYPVSEVTIAGNLLKIFECLLPASDLEFTFGINSPSCLIENMTIAGI